VKPILGKACVPDDSPYTTGAVGLLGTKPSQEAIEECDTLLMVGTSFPYIEFMPRPGQVRAVNLKLRGPSVTPARRAVWGGMQGYFEDTEGNLWEVAHNPDFPIDAEGRITLPE
jgi:thiamine pyrophosphate-dependent acetolactate synthase large subunit-like protein